MFFEHDRGGIKRSERPSSVIAARPFASSRARKQDRPGSPRRLRLGNPPFARQVTELADDVAVDEPRQQAPSIADALFDRGPCPETRSEVFGTSPVLRQSRTNITKPTAVAGRSS